MIVEGGWRRFDFEGQSLGFAVDEEKRIVYIKMIRK